MMMMIMSNMQFFLIMYCICLGVKVVKTLDRCGVIVNYYMMAMYKSNFYRIARSLNEDGT